MEELRSPRTDGNPPHSSATLGFGAHSPKSIQTTSSAGKLQQALFEESLILEAKERATHGAHVQGNTYQSTRQSLEVQISNPKTLYNARGSAYLEGDPNLGYSPKSLKPWYTIDPSADPVLGLDLKPVQQHISQIPLQTGSTIQLQHSHQNNYKPNLGSKPKNWASILQSQGPSMDLKL